MYSLSLAVAVIAPLGAAAPPFSPPPAAPAPPATQPASPDGKSVEAPGDSAESKVVQSAFRDAVDALRRDVHQAPFSADLTVGQAARKLNATQAIDASIQSARQPGGPRWRNKICELRLELPGAELARILADAGRDRPGDLGLTSEAFDRRLAHLQTQTFSALGSGDPRASAEVPTQPAVRPAKPATIVPLDAPPWVSRQLDVEGLGEGSGLKGARAAEAIALAELRRQVEALPLSKDLSLGQAIEKDPRVDKALRDAIRRARVSRVEYGVENVTVRMNLDLDHIWRALVAME